jgi:hypothetical protein
MAAEMPGLAPFSPAAQRWFTQSFGAPTPVQDAGWARIAAGEHAGANMVQVSLNRGAMPHEMFIEQIRRFAKEVLPALQAHEVKGPPAYLTVGE